MLQTYGISFFVPWKCKTCGAFVKANEKHKANERCVFPDPNLSLAEMLEQAKPYPYEAEEQ